MVERTGKELLSNGVVIDFDRYDKTNRRISIKCPKCNEWREVSSSVVSRARRGEFSTCRKCFVPSNYRTDIETLDSGAKIDWSKRRAARSESARENFQYEIAIYCADCNMENWIISSALQEIREGKRTRCWKCEKSYRQNSKFLNHKKKVGRGGYINRMLFEFNQEERKILRPMAYNCHKNREAKRLPEHRALMALSIGRPLTDAEHVHHINLDPSDNRIENLVLLSASEHMKLHQRLRKEKVEQLEKKVKDLELKLEQYEQNKDINLF